MVLNLVNGTQKPAAALKKSDSNDSSSESDSDEDDKVARHDLYHTIFS